MRNLKDEELKKPGEIEIDDASAEDASEEIKEETAEAGEEVTEEKEPEKEDKKKKKDKKQDALKDTIAELEDTTKSQLAEFENVRRRTEKEKATMFDMGAKSVIEKILPVIDNFERGLASVPADEAEDGFYNGMNMIYKQLLGELDKIGVKPIEAKGKEFDPNLHNAVMQVQSDEFESGTVAEELQKGYTYHDSVVRHAMVSVVE
ncbi:MAG: nucleotide exchange factor GrpE [Lachnospiraceae bacterium]|nr:nucleotide exchange factor GrpE [Lachnospiraceae bacterium]